MRIDLPWPDQSLAPNRKNGKHWTATHAANVKRLADARILTLQAMRQQDYVPPAGTLALVVTFHAPDKRRRDLDNLLSSMKADFDGVSQALGVDDPLFDPLTLRRGAPVKGGAVVVEVGHA
jgi:crossover junction endodeoxyribonuclease RusA